MSVETFGSLLAGAGHGDVMRAPVVLGRQPGPVDDYWYNDAPGQVPYFSTPKSSMQSTAFFACVAVISQTIAGLPKNVFERLRNGGRRVAKDHPLNYVMHDVANEEQTSFEFWECSLNHLLSDGNSYAKILTDNRDNVTGLSLLRPDRMMVDRDRETGTRFYRYSDDNGTTVYLDDEILHIPGLGYDGLKGYSPVQLFAQAIGLSTVTETYQSTYFKNSAISPAYLTFAQQINEMSRKEIQTFLEENHGGPANWHKMMILGGGGEIKTLPVNHKDIQFLELRKFQIEEIARIFRVPLHLIQSLDRSTNNNIEHQGIDFATHTIWPWCVRIEQRLNKALLGPRESQRLFIEFNIDGLLRGDTEARGEFYSKLRNTGVLSANDIRRRENMEPIPAAEGGDAYFIQGAMVPMGRLLQMPEPAPAPAAETEEEEETTP